MIQIGVLALQGSVAEHMRMLASIEGITPCEVRSSEDLDTISGIILPGGESTTIAKLLREFGLVEKLSLKIKDGLPVWGTCAGMILLAKEIVGEQSIHLGLMDISVRRNAYGSQLDSFRAKLIIPEVSLTEIHLVFIRAPLVERAWGNARVIARVDGKIAAVRQDNMLVTSFHPELTQDLSFHMYFISMVKNYSKIDGKLN